MEVDPYLDRIGYSGSREPTDETLRCLHRAHVLTTPFENLDIHLGHPIEPSLPAFYDKIVRRRRGGFCYELNGLFGWLLEQLGFRVVMLSARVFKRAQPGPEFDHLVLLVELEARLLADVGFGDSFLEPLCLDSDVERVQNGGPYRLVGSNGGKLLERRGEQGWEAKYTFSLTPRRLADYSVMCHYQQTSPESHFTQNAVCTMATPRGRITLANDRLITTAGGRREERAVSGEAEYRKLLQTHFGIDLGEGERVDRLLVPSVVPENLDGRDGQGS